MRKPLIVVLAGIALALIPTAAYAADEADVGVTTPAWSLVVDAGVWQVANLLVVPLVVGLITKAATSASRKVVANLAITALSTLLAAFVANPDGTAVLSSSTLTMWAISTVVAITGHYGIYKPIGVTGSEPTKGILLPAKGV